MEIKRIIYDSIAYLQKRDHYSGRSKRKFTFNLMVVLKYSKLKEHTSWPKEESNRNFYKERKLNLRMVKI